MVTPRPLVPLTPFERLFEAVMKLDDLNSGDRLLLLAIARFNRTDPTYVTLDALCHAAGCTRKSVLARIKHLEARGYLAVDRSRHSYRWRGLTGPRAGLTNRYRVLVPLPAYTIMVEAPQRREA